MVCALPFMSIAQCVTPLSTITFDSTLTGSGNAFHTFSFPRFDASLGTLVEVNIRAEVTLRYRFQLENKENIDINNYRVRVVRDDEISGNVLQSPIMNNFQTTYGPYMLAAFDGVTGSGPDYTTAGPMYVMNHQVVTRDLYNTADFLGNGTVSLDYMPSTYSIVFGSVNYNFNGTAEDTVRFTVTYRYCSTWFLPADLGSFTASNTGNETIDIRWTTLNEQANRRYVVEKSSDGRTYQSVTSMPSHAAGNATGKYQHYYTPARNETGKLVFRLKQTEADGTIKYSALRVVDLRKKQEPGVVLYPNPSSGNFNILFHNTKRGDWKVDVLTMSGQILKEYQFSRVLKAGFNLQQELPKGSYFIRVTNRKNNEMTIHPVIVR